MGRKRLPEGMRVKDQYKTIILKIPNDLYNEILKDGEPKEVIFKKLTLIYKK